MKKNRTLVVGDIHGELEKLISCLEQANLQPNDRIVFLGDYVDRGPDSFGVVEHLLNMKDKYEMIFIKGNHDAVFFTSYTAGSLNPLFNQGGAETMKSYQANCQESDKFPLFVMPDNHFDFYSNQLHYFVDENNNCFVHGGFDRHRLISEQLLTNLIWDRDMWLAARSFTTMKNTEYKFKIKDNFNEVFIGHTPTQYFDSATPLNYANIWCVDTGAGKFGDGTVTIMDIETKEFWQA